MNQGRSESTYRKHLVRNCLIRILFILLLCITIGYALFNYQYLQKISAIQQQQDDKLYVAASLFDRELGSLEDLLTLLYNSPSLIKQPANTDDPELKNIKERLANIGLASRYISQIRWIDRSGEEKVRVDFRDGNYHIAGDDQLQNKKSRYYLQQSLQVAAPHIYVSPVDLNIEHGQIIEPFEPTVRASISTDKADFLIQGVLVINYNLSLLLDNIRQLSSPESQLSIVNLDGYWLLNTQRQKEWGFMLNTPEKTLVNESPGIWNLLFSQKTSDITVVDDQIVSFRQQTLFSLKVSSAKDNRIFIMATSQPNIIQSIQNTLLWRVYPLGAALFCIGLFIFIRDVKLQLRILKISGELLDEKEALKASNKKLEDNLEQQQQLQNDLVEAQKLSALGMMVAGVAHELNTPIGGAMMSVSTACAELVSLKEAISEGLTKSKLAESMDLLEESLKLAAGNLDKAANQVRSFKRIAIDRANEEYIEFEFNNVVMDLLLSLKPQIKSTNIQIKPDIKENIRMTSRPGVLSQVLQNLIVNCINHAFLPDEKGTITISTTLNNDDEIQITIADDGKGIDTDIQEKIFEPFITTARGEGNTGLGLYFVHQWVTQILHGQIKVKSQPNNGTSFTITLPLQISEA
ncbi:HAMP domain-containing sensor histidine kinase [Alteromonadaceae bacterium BrNp21-10]|nr:HAMP domain-containing sensor histidine kinase [Alteromonadaceae bacterium BrNp21-10]